MQYFYFVLFGALGGIIGGMGMGGGTILIPLLTMALAVPQLEAQAINLIAFVPMAVVTLIIHIKNKLVDFGALLKVLPFALGFSVLSAMFALKIESDILRRIFGAFMLLIGCVFIVKVLKDLLFQYLGGHRNTNYVNKVLRKV